MIMFIRKQNKKSNDDDDRERDDDDEKWMNECFMLVEWWGQIMQMFGCHNIDDDNDERLE